MLSLTYPGRHPPQQEFDEITATMAVNGGNGLPHLAAGRVSRLVLSVFGGVVNIRPNIAGVTAD